MIFIEYDEAGYPMLVGFVDDDSQATTEPQPCATIPPAPPTED